MDFMWDLSAVFECQPQKNLETVLPESGDILHSTMPELSQYSKNRIYKYFHNTKD